MNIALLRLLFIISYLFASFWGFQYDMSMGVLILAEHQEQFEEMELSWELFRKQYLY